MTALGVGANTATFSVAAFVLVRPLGDRERSMGKPPAVSETGEVLQGTLAMLVLKALSLESMHGWGIGNRIGQMARGAFTVPQGSLYPALQRMLRQGLIRSEWRSQAVTSILRTASAEGL